MMKMSREDFIYVWRGSSREDILNQYYWDRKDLMDTIDKAIEYIEHYLEEDRINCGNIYHSVYDELLDILKGNDIDDRKSNKID